jgi:hypothetical protein
MVRQLRLEHQGTVYHLVSRGNARARLFSCSENRAWLLESLDNATEPQTKSFCGLLR